MIDSYMHGDSDVIYINENIPGPSEQTVESKELNENFNSQLICSCKCSDKCCPGICECIVLSGGVNYTLPIQEQINHRVWILKSERKSYPVFECSELCQCMNSCGNRLVQNGPIKTLYVVSSQNTAKGLGLFTNALIPKGSFVCEYAGEVLTKPQAVFRHKCNETHGKMNYIFCLNEHIADKTIQTYIDPCHFGNIGRYINHSCDPNCKIIPVRVNSPIPKLAVFSVLDIKPGAEITFDYGSDDVNGHDFDIIKRKICLCNTNKCRGFLPCLPG